MSIETFPGRVIICAFFLLVVAGCSTTPGDAARKGGHYPQAAELYEVEAKQGDPLAARNLADLYNLRPGLPEDHERAVYWYRKAIERGDIPSLWFVGVIYRDGKGNVPTDYAVAEQYFLRGAEKGQHYSMYDLAGLHADKLTKVTNDIEGLMWLDAVTAFATKCPTTNEGCQYILRDPKRIRETLESRMSSSQKQKSKALADSWVQEWMRKQK